MLELKFSDYEFECGTDEAIRSFLAVKQQLAAVLPLNYKHRLINDSK
jgi:ribonuclease HII